MQNKEEKGEGEENKVSRQPHQTKCPYFLTFFFVEMIG